MNTEEWGFMGWMGENAGDKSSARIKRSWFRNNLS
jgi:hypothetical protein